MTDLALIEGLYSRDDWGEVDGRQFLNELPALVARAIGCSRAGIRVAIETPTGSVLRTVAMYDHAAARLVDAPDLTGEGVRPYLESLGRQGGIVAPDVSSNPRVSGLLRHYGDDAPVRSLMDVGLSRNGLLYGALTCEQLRAPQQWSPRQLHLLRHIALRAGPALVRLIADQAAAVRRR